VKHARFVTGAAAENLKEMWVTLPFDGGRPIISPLSVLNIK
jgi:hypothetical protein